MILQFMKRRHVQCVEAPPAGGMGIASTDPTGYGPDLYTANCTEIRNSNLSGMREKNRVSKSFGYHMRSMATRLTITLLSMIASSHSYGAEPMSGTYIAYGKSMFDFTAGTNAYMSGGVPVSYPVDISLGQDGKAIISGLLGTRNQYESVTGTYDSAFGTIHFVTPGKETTSVKPYQFLGESDGYDNYLCAFNPYGIGYLEDLKELDLKFSEDCRSIYPSSGVAAGIIVPVTDRLFTVSGYQEAIYDLILLKKEEGISFNIDYRFADIPNTYPDTEVTSTFRIYNTGSEESDYVIASSSPLFHIQNPSGSLKPGEYSDIRISFVTSSTGDYTTTLTVTNESTDIRFDVKARCAPLPDYTQIVTESETRMVFSTDSDYPWIISDNYIEGPVAVNTNTGKEMTESSLYVDLSISEKHFGLLSWKGSCDPDIPGRDLFVVRLDGEEVYISPNDGGRTDSEIRIAPGKHRVEFSYLKGARVNGSFARGSDYALINAISLTESPLPANSCRLNENRINFQPKSIVRGSANEETTIHIINEGYDPLKIHDAECDNDSFSVIFGSDPISTFETYPIIVKFHSSVAGKHSGNITLHTTAGDIVVRCSGEAIAIPDYSPIVSKGDFWFDTSIMNPFTVAGDKAYNSTSMKKDRRQTSSMLQAMFEVPEGYYGELTWNARVSSAGTEQKMTDYATIYIDGEEITQNYYGEMDASHLSFTPSQVNFYPGEHFIAFAYNQAGDAKFEGDDRIEVSGLSLELKKMSESEVRPWGEPKVTFDDVKISKAYIREVNLVNFGSRPLKVISATSDGPFSAEIDSERLYNTFEKIQIPVSFIPEKNGTLMGEILIRTSAGDIKVSCLASVAEDPTTLIVEDFEDDMRLWNFVDFDGDGISWDLTTSPMNAYRGNFALQSFSIHGDFSESPIDDIAISPEFTIPAEGAELSFYLACFNTEVEDSLEITAGEGDDPAKFDTVEILDLFNVDPYYNHYRFDLDALAGRKVRLGLRHRLDSPVMSFIAIDNLHVISKAPGSIACNNFEKVVSVEYFTLDGLKTDSLQEGFYIRRTHFTDGSVITEKVCLNH